MLPDLLPVKVSPRFPIMLISLICTYFNRENYLPLAIQSVIDQNFDDWELILWDDGSTDGSRAIADRAPIQDPRVWSGGTVANQDRAMALRNAIQASKGEWFGLIDSDDFLTPYALATVAPYARQTNGMIYSDRILINADGNFISHQSAYSPQTIRQTDLLGNVPFHLQLYNRATFDRTTGVDLNLNSATDYDMALKMLDLPIDLIHIPEPLYYHRIHDARISADMDYQTLEALQATRNAINRRGLPLDATLRWSIGTSIITTPEPHPNAGDCAV